MTALVECHGRAVALFVGRAMVPALLITLVALACGLVRTAALGAFCLIALTFALLKVLITALDTVGAAVPSPRWEVPR